MKNILVLILVIALFGIQNPIASEQPIGPECGLEDQTFLNFYSMPQWAQDHWRGSICEVAIVLSLGNGWLKKRPEIYVTWMAAVFPNRALAPGVYELLFIIVDAFPLPLKEDFVYTYAIGLLILDDFWPIYPKTTTWTASGYDLFGCDSQIVERVVPKGLCIERK